MTPRYSCFDSAQVWTDHSRLARFFRVWTAATPLHPPVTPTASDLVRWEALERDYGHDIAAAAEVLRERLVTAGRSHEARLVHYGLCSSDVADAGLALGITEATLLLRDQAREVNDALHRLVAQDGDAVYRTHGQAAQVAPASGRWHGLAIDLVEASRRLLLASRGVGVPSFTGPTGNSDTGVLSSEDRRALKWALFGGEVAKRPTNVGTQAVSRASHVEWVHSVAGLATWAERFGTTVRLLAATGVDEVAEGRGESYRGSSSMPHKVNPTRSERLCGLAPVVRGLAGGYAEAAASHWDAHSLEHSSAERVVIPQVCELVGFMLGEATEIASELVILRADVARNVKRAPADSFARRSELVRRGGDAGEAWKQVAAETRGK